MPLPNGAVLNIVTIGGAQPSLGQYVLYAATTVTIQVELVDSNGATIWQGAVPITGGTAITLQSAVTAVNASALSAWPNAAGAFVANNGATAVQFNTSGQAVGALAPTANSILAWLPGGTYAMGYVSS